MIKFLKKLKSAFIGSASLLSPFHIEADRSPSGLDLSVGGVRAILSYSETEIELRTVIGKLGVLGSVLSISVYDDQTVKIKGKIEEVRLAYSKN